MGEGFSIGVLADRTGLTPTVLRTWENRFGFPSGTRSPSGHRRFSDADVDLVRQVQDLRSSGVSLRRRRRHRAAPATSPRRVGPRGAGAGLPPPGPAETGATSPRRGVVRRRGRGAGAGRAAARAGVLPGGSPLRGPAPQVGRARAHGGVVGRRRRVRRRPPRRPRRHAGAVPAARPVRPAARVDGGHADRLARRPRLGLGGAGRRGCGSGLRVGHQRPPPGRGGRGPRPARRGPCGGRRARPRTSYDSSTSPAARPRPSTPTGCGCAPSPHLDAVRLTRGQWLRSASISSDLFIFERPSIPSSPARLRSSSTVRSS